MLDRGSFWTAASSLSQASFTSGALHVDVMESLYQVVLSGSPCFGKGALADVPPPLGFNDVAVGTTYAAALARDRILVVSPEPLGIVEGWDAATGIAATTMDDGLTIFDVFGADLDDLIGMATTIGRGERTASSAILFASIPCVAYRHASRTSLRIHVERPLAPHLAQWIRRAMEAGRS